LSIFIGIITALVITLISSLCSAYFVSRDTSQIGAKQLVAIFIERFIRIGEFLGSKDGNRHAQSAEQGANCLQKQQIQLA
jgi:hypothetical protein